MRDSIPTPYTGGSGSMACLFRVAGYLSHAMFARELWNIHCMNVGFAADELVILPETVVPRRQTSLLFVYGGRDPYTLSDACLAYIDDMMRAPHIRAVNFPSHG